MMTPILTGRSRRPACLQSAPYCLRNPSKDPVISIVRHYVKEGWPHMMDSKDVLHYKKLVDSLIMENGCPVFRAQIVIPARLRNQVLQLIYLGRSEPIML